MSLWIMIAIMVSGGLTGGVVNYFLPDNNPERGKFVYPIWNCIFLGIGATLLVPLFLEIAQSKLMDDIHIGWQWEKVSTGAADANTGLYKQYLLWTSYCLLAGAAGFRFINMIINNTVKQGEVNKIKTENADLKKEKVKREMNSQRSQLEEAEKVHLELANENLSNIKKGMTDAHLLDKIEIPVIPVLPPIKHPEDPQKGRFGGLAENNGRRLSAEVKQSNSSDYYNVTLTVDSTDGKPLNTDVILYIHDSFSPSVYTISPGEFHQGKAIDDEIVSYGAFTVGVITDNGKTFLELDLSEDKRFPKEFRSR